MPSVLLFNSTREKIRVLVSLCSIKSFKKPPNSFLWVLSLVKRQSESHTHHLCQTKRIKNYQRQLLAEDLVVFVLLAWFNYDGHFLMQCGCLENASQNLILNTSKLKAEGSSGARTVAYQMKAVDLM